MRLRTSIGSLGVAFGLVLLTLAANPVAADVTINCDRGQSLNQALSFLPRNVPVNVTVNGTCTEYITVAGFEGLTLRSTSGAVLRQPSFAPKTMTGVLSIVASRSVTLDGLTVETTQNDGSLPALWIHDGSTHVRIRRATVIGEGPGIYISDLSEVSMANLTVRTKGWGAIGIWHSKASVEDSLLENPGDDYQNGIQVGQNGVLLISGTRIRHMWEGISALDGGTVNVQDVNDELPYGGPTAVVIDSPPPIQLWGLGVRNGGRVTLGAPLRILNPGASWGGETGGVELDGASSLAGGQNLEIQESIGQGVFVKNNSHASLGGAHVTTTSHNGVAAVNHSTVDLGDVAANTPTSILGSGAYDLFCDGTSLITGVANAPTVATIECSNRVAGPYPPLP